MSLNIRSLVLFCAALLLIQLPSTAKAIDGLDIVVGLDESDGIQARISARDDVCAQNLRDISLLPSRDYNRFGLPYPAASREMNITKVGLCNYRVSAGRLTRGGASNLLFKVTTSDQHCIVRLFVSRPDLVRLHVRDNILACATNIALAQKPTFPPAAQPKVARHTGGEPTRPVAQFSSPETRSLSQPSESPPTTAASSMAAASMSLLPGQVTTSPVTQPPPSAPLTATADQSTSHGYMDQSTILLATCFVLALVFFFSVTVIFLSRHNGRDLIWDRTSSEQLNRQSQPLEQPQSTSGRLLLPNNSDQLIDIEQSLAISAAHHAAATKLTQIKMAHLKALAQAAMPQAAFQEQGAAEPGVAQPAAPQTTPADTSEAQPLAAQQMPSPTPFKNAHSMATQQRTSVGAPSEQSAPSTSSTAVREPRAPGAYTGPVQPLQQQPGPARVAGIGAKSDQKIPQPQTKEEAIYAAISDKLDMANVYLNMQDLSAARILLQEVYKTGSAEQVEQAKLLLAQIEEME